VSFSVASSTVARRMFCCVLAAATDRLVIEYARSELPVCDSDTGGMVINGFGAR
jgi:hypothetical protein